MTPLSDFRRLIVGSDFSPASSAALRLALGWAAGRQWELEVVHVVRQDFPEGGETGLRKALERAVSLAAEKNEGVRWSVSVQRGEALEVLTARAAGSAWLALGTEGSGSEALRRCGGVARRACASSPVPVLLAPPRWRPVESGRRAPVPTFNRVLVGLSGGDRDEARLRAALHLARPGRPSVLHAVDLSWSRCYPAEIRAMATEPAEKLLDAFLSGFLTLEDELVDVGDEGSGLDLHLLRQGPIHRDLAGLAESQSAELLLVGTGPTTELLAGLSALPVLVLP